VKHFLSRPKVVVVAQSNMKKNKEETSAGVIQILGAAVATEEISRRDPQRNKLEYV